MTQVGGEARPSQLVQPLSPICLFWGRGQGTSPLHLLTSGPAAPGSVCPSRHPAFCLWACPRASAEASREHSQAMPGLPSASPCGRLVCTAPWDSLVTRAPQNPAPEDASPESSMESGLQRPSSHCVPSPQPNSAWPPSWLGLPGWGSWSPTPRLNPQDSTMQDPWLIPPPRPECLDAPHPNSTWFPHTGLWAIQGTPFVDMQNFYEYSFL